MQATARLPSYARGANIALHRTIDSFRADRRLFDRKWSVGFVPTMGALHEGHLSLVRAAKERNDVVVASIFVNPTQFGAGEDLDKYPRQLERDVELLDTFGVDHVFAPDSSSMYGPHHTTFVDPHGFDETREGKERPGHFRGVATIVMKLLNIVQPTHAYFGQKDATQCVMIRRMVEDLDMDVAIEIQETIREVDGLAMSSRNAYLTPTQRAAAPIVYQSLCVASDMFKEIGSEETSITANSLEEAVRSRLSLEPLVSEIQYIAVDDRATMRRLLSVRKSDGAVVSLACKIGNVRLIDNIILQ